MVEWGESFWKDTEYRIREVTNKFESKITASLGAKAGLLTAKGGGTDHLSTEEKGEIIHHAQEVVKEIQIRALNEVIGVLAEDFLNQPQPRFYLIIDRLDENWVEDQLRYRLIRALIETIKEFRKIKSAKIVIALRQDLLERLIRDTRDAGFQEEKYHPLYLLLKWRADDLLALLDRRINKVVKRQYTKAPVSWSDFMPQEVDRRSVDKFIVDRTLYRPRDVIVFFNCCIDQAVGRPDITATIVKNAEAEYSRRRFRSLGDEWFADYPELLDFAELLKQRPSSFRVDDLELSTIIDSCLAISTARPESIGVLREWALKVSEDKLSPEDFRNSLIKVFYDVGLVGLKTERFTVITWSYRDYQIISAAEVRDDTVVQVSPAFYRVLGIDAGTRRSRAVAR